MEAKQTGAIHVPSGEGRSLWVAGFPHTLKATSEDANGVYSVLEVSVGPQAGPPPHIHHWEDEALYILEGEFEIFENGNTMTASLARSSTSRKGPCIVTRTWERRLPGCWRCSPRRGSRGSSSRWASLPGKGRTRPR